MTQVWRGERRKADDTGAAVTHEAPSPSCHRDLSGINPPVAMAISAISGFRALHSRPRHLDISIA